MASTTEQRIKMDGAIAACLEAGDDPEEIQDHVTQVIDDWKTDNIVEDDDA